MAISPLRERPAFDALARHHAKLADRHLRELFAEDPARGEGFCAEARSPATGIKPRPTGMSSWVGPGGRGAPHW